MRGLLELSMMRREPCEVGRRADMFSEQRQLTAARRLFEHLAKVVDVPFSLRLGRHDGAARPRGAGRPLCRDQRPGR
ncbi:MAG: hypothetical protein ACREH3_05420, partial [Geminicoccales bacterium]